MHKYIKRQISNFSTLLRVVPLPVPRWNQILDWLKVVDRMTGRVTRWISACQDPLQTDNVRDMKQVSLNPQAVFSRILICLITAGTGLALLSLLTLASGCVSTPQHTDRICGQRPQRLWPLVPVQNETKPEQSDPRAISQATNLFVAAQYSNCVAFCRGNAATLGAQGLYIAAECHARLGDVPAAVSELREIENFYKGEGSKAAMRMATLYHEAKKEYRYVAELRRLVKRYPESKEAKEAEKLLFQMNQVDWPVFVE